MNRMRTALVMATCILLAASASASAAQVGEFPWQTSGGIHTPPPPPVR